MERYYHFNVAKFKTKKCNFHSHTIRCRHAYGEEREYIEKAIEAGFEVIGFSDHAPYDGFLVPNVACIRMGMSQLEDYVKTIETLKEEYKKDITIFTALEMEYFPDIFEPTIEKIQQYPMDYLILAQHFFPREEEFISTRAVWKEEKYIRLYINLLEEAIDTGFFDMVAHPDILNFVGDNTLYTTYMTMLAQRLKKENIPIEINVNGFRANINYPDERFLKIGAENGNDFIIGVDAHHPNDYLDIDSYNGCIQMGERLKATIFWK